MGTPIWEIFFVLCVCVVVVFFLTNLRGRGALSYPLYGTLLSLISVRFWYFWKLSCLLTTSLLTRQPFIVSLCALFCKVLREVMTSWSECCLLGNLLIEQSAEEVHVFLDLGEGCVCVCASLTTERHLSKECLWWQSCGRPGYCLGQVLQDQCPSLMHDFLDDGPDTSLSHSEPVASVVGLPTWSVGNPDPGFVCSLVHVPMNLSFLGSCFSPFSSTEPQTSGAFLWILKLLNMFHEKYVRSYKIR